MELVKSKLVRSLVTDGEEPISYTTEKRWQDEGKLPLSTKIGKRTFYLRSDLEEKGFHVNDEHVCQVSPGSARSTLPDHTIQDICQVCQCSAPTVYSLIKSGQLKSYKVGRSTRITRESLEQLRQGAQS